MAQGFTIPHVVVCYELDVGAVAVVYERPSSRPDVVVFEPLIPYVRDADHLANWYVLSGEQTQTLDV